VRAGSHIPTPFDSNLVPDDATPVITYPVAPGDLDYLDLHDQSANASDSSAKMHTPAKQLQIRYPKGRFPDCSSGFMVGDCENGHRYLKVLLCGKEWCPDCGEKWSWLHQRRYYRLLPKLKTLAKKTGGIGYLIITIPLEMREWALNKKHLNAFRRYIIEFMKRQGYEIGIRAWHWAGEDGKKWHPHLNLLFESCWIKEEELNHWKELFTAWLESETGINIPGKTINIWYNYSEVPGKQKHWLRYVVKPTLRVFNPVICAIIKGNRNIGTWGDWENKTEQNKIAELENNLCPECKTKLDWHWEPLHDLEYHLNNFDEIQAGYYKRKQTLLPYDSQIPDPPKPAAPRYVPLEFSFTAN